MTENIFQGKIKSLEFPPQKDIQNSSNNNDIQSLNIDNINNSNDYPKFFKSYESYLYNNFNDWFNSFYDDGIANYCKITQNNASILNNLKDKYFKIIIDDIIKKILKTNTI